MKTIRLVFTLSTLRVLNSSPISGIEPRNGTCDCSRAPASEIRPPSTMMPPSSTMHLGRDRALVRDQVGAASPAVSLAATLEASCEILSSTESPSLICGVILRIVADFLALHRRGTD